MEGKKAGRGRMVTVIVMGSHRDRDGNRSRTGTVLGKEIGIGTVMGTGSGMRNRDKNRDGGEP